MVALIHAWKNLIWKSSVDEGKLLVEMRWMVGCEWKTSISHFCSNLEVFYFSFFSTFFSKKNKFLEELSLERKLRWPFYVPNKVWLPSSERQLICSIFQNFQKFNRYETKGTLLDHSWRARIVLWSTTLFLWRQGFIFQKYWFWNFGKRNE